MQLPWLAANKFYWGSVEVVSRSWPCPRHPLHVKIQNHQSYPNAEEVHKYKKSGGEKWVEREEREEVHVKGGSMLLAPP